MNDAQKAIEDLKTAIQYHPEFKEYAKTDTDFDKIKQTQAFIELIMN